MTLFASRHLWPDLPKLHRHARQHGVWLTDRGEVILDGEGVGTYELAGRQRAGISRHPPPEPAGRDLRSSAGRV